MIITNAFFAKKLRLLNICKTKLFQRSRGIYNANYSGLNYRMELNMHHWVVFNEKINFFLNQRKKKFKIYSEIKQNKNK